MSVTIDACGATDPGKVRENNEDHFLVADLGKTMLIRQTSLSHEDKSRAFSGSQGHVYVVADGMGGTADGEVASTLAVETVLRYTLGMAPAFLGADASSQEEIKENMVSALRRCESTVQSHATDQPNRRRMGTTVTMAYLLWPELFVVHVGDSRCYVWRTGQLYQVTTDHTVAQKLVDRGALDPAKAGTSRLGNVLSQAVGGSERGIDPEVHQVGLEAGDIILLCSDGLTRELSDGAIAKALGAADSARRACDVLIDAANAAGGEDNVTVVVARAV